jgi:hypothetical protein
MSLYVNVRVSLEEARSLYQCARAAGKYYRHKDFGDEQTREAFISRVADAQRLGLSILAELWEAAQQLPEGDPVRIEIATYGDDLYDAYQLVNGDESDV